MLSISSKLSGNFSLNIVSIMRIYFNYGLGGIRQRINCTCLNKYKFLIDQYVNFGKITK